VDIHQSLIQANSLILISNKSLDGDATQVILINIVIIFVLILLNGFFAASEMAIVTLNETKLRADAGEGDENAKKLLTFVDNQGSFLATVQVGVTFAGFLSSAFGANQITPYVYQFFDPHGVNSYLEPLITIIITFIISYFSLVIGELVPKQIGMRDPEAFARRFVAILRGWDIIVRPFASFLNASARLVCKIIGIDIDKGQTTITEEEILLMTKASGESGAIQSDEARMIYNVFELNDTEVSEIMTPRTAMVALDVAASLEEVIYTAAHEKYSRLPVYEENIDNIIGVLHIKDILRITPEEKTKFDLRNILREVYFVPEGKAISVLFREMQQQNISLAIVIDEYGGTDGLITIEDILEEIVGDITDEYDSADQCIIKNVDGSYIIDGMLSVEEVVERIPEIDRLDDKENFDYDTIAGFILSKLERIPEQGEHPSVRFEDFIFTVLEMDEKRIARIKVEFSETNPKDSKNREEDKTI